MGLRKPCFFRARNAFSSVPRPAYSVGVYACVLPPPAHANDSCAGRVALFGTVLRMIGIRAGFLLPFVGVIQLRSLSRSFREPAPTTIAFWTQGASFICPAWAMALCCEATFTLRILQTVTPQDRPITTDHGLCFPPSCSWTKLETLHSDIVGRSHILGGESAQMVAAIPEPSELKNRVGTLLEEAERSDARDAFAAASLALIGALTSATGALANSQKEVQRCGLFFFSLIRHLGDI